ncbi:MAG TPA: phage minor head protein [Rhizomicrobium sp.]|jgi:uncharacterized protein with gpF-like domain
MADLVFRNIAPTDAIDAFGQRLASPSPSYSWLDVFDQMHAQSFTVAKSAGFDILDDISSALDDALKNGTTFQDFAKQLQPILADKGWWGRGPAFDPISGTLNDAQLGSLRRLQTIFDTNMRVSYQAGQWAGIQRNISDQPYLMYDHTTSAHPRAEHLAWDGTALPADDPWWDTHYPPNGWGCKCGVIALSKRQYDQMSASGLITTSAPKTIWQIFTNARTGETSRVPAGIDPGFGYNVGKAFLEQLAA